jgi:hypothetical protein
LTYHATKILFAVLGVVPKMLPLKKVSLLVVNRDKCNTCVQKLKFDVWYYAW